MPASSQTAPETPSASSGWAAVQEQDHRHHEHQRAVHRQDVVVADLVAEQQQGRNSFLQVHQDGEDIDLDQQSRPVEQPAAADEQRERYEGRDHMGEIERESAFDRLLRHLQALTDLEA